MTSENSPALNRYYHPLSEATNVLKARGKSLSVCDLLHYGVQSSIRFFIYLPSGMRARRIFGHPQNEFELQPSLLILSPLQCGEIECNKMAKYSDFPSAYLNLYSHQEIPPYPKEFVLSPGIHWQIVDSNDVITPIPISLKTIYIVHNELNHLIQLLDNQYCAPVKKFTPQIDEELQTEINHRCYSFEEALKLSKEKIDAFTEIDLLRYGYFEKLTFLIQRPKNLQVSIANQKNPPTTDITPGHKLDLLALDPEDCYQIEIFGSTTRSNFKVGFLCHNRTLLPISAKPTSDCIWEAVGLSNVRHIMDYRLRVDIKSNKTHTWCTYNESKQYELEITKDKLYVIRPQFDRLVVAESMAQNTGQVEPPYIPEFTISDLTKYHLSPKHFITLSDAASLAKCYTNELLIHASQGTFELLTPVPCEIAICQGRKPVNNLDELSESQTNIYPSVEEIPQLFVLENADCEAIVANGRVTRGHFKTGYSFSRYRLVRRTPYYLRCTNPLSEANSPASDSDKREGVWLTFYLDKPKEIDITVDRIFVELSRFQATIEFSSNVFRSKNDSFFQFEPSITGQLNSGNPETTSAVSREPLRTGLTCDSASLDDISATEEFVTVSELIEMAGISRTTITNKTKNGHKDSNFPTKIKNNENGHVYFLKSEVVAWIRENPPRKRKRSPL